MIKVVAVVAVLIATFFIISSLMGPGTIERATTLSGIYAVLRPDGYDVVCFSNKHANDYLSCIPCSLANCDKK